MANRDIKKNQFRKSGRRRNGGKGPGLRRVTMILGLTLFVSLITVLMGGICVFTYDMVTQSDYFAIKVIQVNGLESVSEKEILKLAGIEKGMNILGMNLNQVREKLLSHPFIESVSVERVIPSDLRITVRENHPLAIADIGDLFLISESGQIFKKREKSDPKALPVISGLTLQDFEDYKSEKRKTNNLKVVMDFITLSKKQEGALSYKNIKMIQMDREMGISLTLGGPVKTVKLGFSDYHQKFERVKEIIALSGQIEQINHIGVIDLNNLNRIVITPAET